MTAKIVAFVITLLTNVVVGVAVFFSMLLAMNGYHESDATYGLVTYIVLALVISLAMSTAAWLTVRYLQKRQFQGWSSALIAVPTFSVIGGGLKIVCGIIGVLITEYVRVNH